MTRLEITLPEEMIIFVEAQVAARQLDEPSQFVQALIARAQKEQEELELEHRFADAVRAMERGESNPLSLSDWQRLQQRVLNRPAADDPAEEP
jgi:hypothetical protein